MKRRALHISISILIAAAVVAQGCNDTSVESDGEDLCLRQENFNWFTSCETEADCCLGDDPLCRLVPAISDEKVCTRECTTAPEDEPIEDQCCITSQDHDCGTGCCMVNYIEPDAGTSVSGWGIGTCVPEDM